MHLLLLLLLLDCAFINKIEIMISSGGIVVVRYAF